jgi:hypothetical protein
MEVFYISMGNWNILYNQRIRLKIKQKKWFLWGIFDILWGIGNDNRK